MKKFLIGFGTGFLVAGLALFGVLAGYNPPVVSEWEDASLALAILITALWLIGAALAVLGVLSGNRDHNRQQEDLEVQAADNGWDL